MKKIMMLISLALVGLLFLGATSENGKTNFNLPYETQGQNNLFVTASGSGDCSSWERACSFRTAVAKCTDDVQDVIWMSPEDHDTDNGSDGTGTDITAKNVRIVGAGVTHQFSTRLFNGHATASIVITASGHRVTFENLRFTQENKTDKDVTYLNITGSRSVVSYCDFRSATGAISDIGIYYNGSSRYHFAEHVHLRNFTDAGIRTNGTDHLELTEMFFEANATGMDFTHVDDGPVKIESALFKNCTTGIDIAVGVIGLEFDRPIFIDNTNAIGSVGDYDVLHLFRVILSHPTIGTYPASAGTTITGGAGAYAQGALTEIIPAATITDPFFLQGINIQTASSTDTCKLEIFYGENAGTATSLGVFEFISDRKVGVSVRGFDVSAFPGNSYIGAKLATASGGGATVTLTLSYLGMD